MAFLKSLYELFDCGCNPVLRDRDMVDTEEVVVVVVVNYPAHVDGDILYLHVFNLIPFTAACFAVMIGDAEDSVSYLEFGREELFVFLDVPDLYRVFERAFERSVPVVPEGIHRFDFEPLGEAVVPHCWDIGHWSAVFVYHISDTFVAFVEHGGFFIGGFAEFFDLGVVSSGSADVVVRGDGVSYQVPVVPGFAFLVAHPVR